MNIAIITARGGSKRIPHKNIKKFCDRPIIEYSIQAAKEADIFEKLSQSQPIGRMGKPDEVAALALFLCSDEASFITGSDYPIDGGFIKLNN